MRGTTNSPLMARTMDFPNTVPVDDRVGVSRCQLELLAHIESWLGPHDPAKLIYPPKFRDRGDDEGPCLVNTLSCDGAFARLSRNAANYWPSTIFELAHETVHLLNPVEGLTNWLEEGVAVAASHRCLRLYGHGPMGTNPVYEAAHDLVASLPGGAIDFGLAVRTQLGSLNGFSGAELSRAFPVLSADLALRLASVCDPG
jgi:hypothetical protein